MDGVDGVVERAGGDPVAARSEVLLAARRLAVPELPEFFEAACRGFRTAGHMELAAAMFGLARQVEETHERMLALPIDHDRVREVFVELAADGVITPAALHDYLKRQASRPDRDAARADARVVAGAFFDAGTVPYPNLPAELIALAPGKAQQDEETDHLAERLLRAGLLATAALPVWETVLPALSRVIQRAPELLDLLVAAEPAAGVHANPELAGRMRALWLDALARARAGARMPREWFLGLGPGPARSLLLLADQAGERLFPPGHGPAPADDPALAVPSDPDPLAYRKLSDRDKRDEQGSGWYSKDPATLPELRRTDPAAFDRAMDAFIRHLGYYNNIDYPRALRGMKAEPDVAQVLDEQVARWTAEAAADDLYGLEVALPRLVPLAEAGYFGADVPSIADPVTALLHALRSGIPEELRFPGFTPPGNQRSYVTVVQHDDLITLGLDGSIEVHGPDGVIDRRTAQVPVGLQPWYDGETYRVSRAHGQTWQTFRLAGEGELELEPGSLDRWPQAPAAAEVVFPGAVAPSLVRLRRGRLWLSTPEGRITARPRFSPAQPAGPGPSQLLPPPGWWPHLKPVDEAGSAALRRLDRTGAEELVDAGLRGPAALVAQISRLLPEITEPRLRDGVQALVLRAADCQAEVVRLLDRLGAPRPDGLPASVRSVSGLRHGREVKRVVVIRTLAEHVQEAARSAQRRDLAYPVDTIELPPGSGGIYSSFGELGANAVAAAWPWTPEYERDRMLATLRSWGDTPWGDGSGRWRMVDFVSRAGQQKPEGELWRTPNGALIMVGPRSIREKPAIAVEYSPDGTFQDVDLPGWAMAPSPIPQGWGGAERILEFDRLLAERGPAPYDVDAVRELAARTGITLPEVASACFGYPYFVGRDNELARYPQEVLDLYVEPGVDRPRKTPLSYRLDREMRPQLMPDDPADLWTRGLNIDRATTWWTTQEP